MLKTINIPATEGEKKRKIIIRRRENPLVPPEEKPIFTGEKIEEGDAISSKTYLNFCEMGDIDKINMDEFAEKGIYSKEEVERDKERVRKIKSDPSYVKPTDASIALENILNQLGEFKGLFSDSKNTEVHCFRLSEFDDMIKDSTRGDIAVEIKLPDGGNNEKWEHICLLIDATTAVNDKKHFEKRRKCLEEIEYGNLHSVKYFKSKITGRMGRRENLPMVIAGIDEKSIKKLCLRYEKGILPEKDYAQIIFLEEITKQLNFFCITAKKFRGEDHLVTKKLIRAHEVFSEILKTKKSLRPDDFERKAVADKVYEYLNNEFTSL